MRVILETKRLIPREWTLEDASAAFTIYGDPAVMRFIGATGRPDPDVAHTRAGLERAIARYPARPGLGFWAAVERRGGEVIGAGLLKDLDGGPEVEVATISRSGPGARDTQRSWHRHWSPTDSTAWVWTASSASPTRKTVPRAVSWKKRV